MLFPKCMTCIGSDMPFSLNEPTCHTSISNCSPHTVFSVYDSCCGFSTHTCIFGACMSTRYMACISSGMPCSLKEPTCRTSISSCRKHIISVHTQHASISLCQMHDMYWLWHAFQLEWACNNSNSSCISTHAVCASAQVTAFIFLQNAWHAPSLACVLILRKRGFASDMECIS